MRHSWGEATNLLACLTFPRPLWSSVMVLARLCVKPTCIYFPWHTIITNENCIQVGDPIETQAVANVFGEHDIYIGSVS